MNPLTWQKPGQLFVAQDIIKVKIYSVAELRIEKKNTLFRYYFVSRRFVTKTNFYIFAQLLHYNNYIIFGIMMNKNQIGTNAGIVWKLLSDNAHWEYDKLKQASGLSDRDLNAAIGWLAREDKIDFDIDEQHDRLFLHVNVYIG